MRSMMTAGPLRAVAALSIGLVGAIAGVTMLTTQSDQALAQETGEAPSGPPPAPVVVSEAVKTVLTPYAEAPGSAVSVGDSLVSAATGGKVEWIAEIGAEIQKGDVIARIDPADAQLARDEARADIGRLQARADFLKTRVARFESLGEEAGESEVVLDEMRANRDEAQQNLARARVTLKRAEINLDRTEIKAPFSGRIVSREIEVGEFSNIGSPIARLVDTKNLEVTARAPAQLIANIAAGDEVDVLYRDATVAAIVRAVVPVGDEISRTLEMRLSLDQTGWPIGAPVRVKVPAAAAKSSIAVHRDALILRADRVAVFKVNDDNVATRIDVETGIGDGELIEVIGDIAEGDRVIVRGAERLRDGQTVTIQEKAIAVSQS